MNNNATSPQFDWFSNAMNPIKSAFTNNYSNAPLAKGGLGQVGIRDLGNGWSFADGGFGNKGTAFNLKTGAKIDLGKSGWGNALDAIGQIGNIWGMFQGNSMAKKQLALQREAMEFEKEKWQKNFEMAMNAYRRKHNLASAQTAFGRSGQTWDDLYRINDKYNTGDEYLSGSEEAYVPGGRPGEGQQGPTPMQQSAFAAGLGPVEDPYRAAQQTFGEQTGIPVNTLAPVGNSSQIAGRSAFANSTLPVMDGAIPTMDAARHSLAGNATRAEQQGASLPDAQGRVVKRRRKKSPGTADENQNTAQQPEG